MRWIGRYRIIDLNYPHATISNLELADTTPITVHLNQIRKYYLPISPMFTDFGTDQSQPEQTAPENQAIKPANTPTTDNGDMTDNYKQKLRSYKKETALDSRSSFFSFPLALKVFFPNRKIVHWLSANTFVNFVLF